MRWAVVAVALGLIWAPIVEAQRPAERLIATFGRWSVNDVGDYTAAFTSNDSGSIFGVLCGTTCIMYLNLQHTCTSGHHYPAMLSSPAGASSLSLRCVHVDQNNLLTTALSDDYVAMFTAGGEAGFAVPLQSGQFSVSRFTLQGGSRAVARAINEAEAKRNRSQRELRDFTI